MKHIFGSKNKTNQPSISQQITEAAIAVAKNLGAATTIDRSEYFPGWDAFAYVDDKIRIEYTPSQSRHRYPRHYETIEIWQTVTRTSGTGYYFEKSGEHTFYHKADETLTSLPKAGDAWVHHLLRIVYVGHLNGIPYKSPEDLKLEAEQKAYHIRQQEIATFRTQYPPRLRENILSVLHDLGTHTTYYESETYEDDKISIRRYTKYGGRYDDTIVHRDETVSTKSLAGTITVFYETDSPADVTDLIFRPGKWIDYINTTLITKANRVKAAKKAAEEQARQAKEQEQATRNIPIDDSDIFP